MKHNESDNDDSRVCHREYSISDDFVTRLSLGVLK